MIRTKVIGGKLLISFPKIEAGQAIIAAIAIASEKPIIGSPLGNRIAGGLIQQQLPENRHWQSWLDLGAQQYADKPTTFSQLPSSLFGADWLQFSANEVPHDQWVMAKPGSVLIGLATGTHLPNWMNGFEDTHETIDNDAGIRFHLYQKKLATGDSFTLGPPSSKDLYIVVLKQETVLEPAYDLKPIQTYKAINAPFKQGLSMATINDKPALQVVDSLAILDLAFETGVGDRYSLTFKYANTLGKSIPVTMELFMADGLSLKKEILTFSPSQIGKWNYANTNTGTMINAGKYRIRLSAKLAIGLAISGVDIQ